MERELDKGGSEGREHFKWRECIFLKTIHTYEWLRLRMIVWEEVEESGHRSTCERLCAKLKSMNYSLKRGWEPLKNFKQENYISKFIF